MRPGCFVNALKQGFQQAVHGRPTDLPASQDSQSGGIAMKIGFGHGLILLHFPLCQTVRKTSPPALAAVISAGKEQYAVNALPRVEPMVIRQFRLLLQAREPLEIDEGTKTSQVTLDLALDTLVEDLALHDLQHQAWRGPVVG